MKTAASLIRYHSSLHWSYIGLSNDASLIMFTDEKFVVEFKELHTRTDTQRVWHTCRSNAAVTCCEIHQEFSSSILHHPQHCSTEMTKQDDAYTENVKVIIVMTHDI